MKFSMFTKPTADKVAQAELEDARLQLLGYLSQAEFATSMARYYRDKIDRLSAYLAPTTNTEGESK